eukprot:PhM_4_TR10804/c0_g1_i1/m.82518/K06110/EXOC3, SEC6; exocyst complex component 3
MQKVLFGSSTVLSAEEQEQTELDVAETVQRKLREFDSFDSRLDLAVDVARNERKEIEGQLRTISRQQVLDGFGARTVVETSATRLKAQVTSLRGVTDVIQRLRDDDDDYEQLRRLFFARRNVRQVHQYAGKMIAFMEKSEELGEAIREGRLLDAYIEVTEVLGIVSEAQGAKLPPARMSKVMAAYRPYLDLANSLAHKLVSKWQEIVSNTYNTSIKLATDDEDANDAEMMLREAIEVMRVETREGMFKEVKGFNGVSPMSFEALKGRLETALEKYWDTVMHGLESGSDVAGTLERMTDITNLVQYLSLFVVEMFPEEMGMRSWFLSQLHATMLDHLTYFSQPHVGLISRDQIDCVNWLTKYEDTLRRWEFFEFIDADRLERLREIFVSQALVGMADHLTDLCQKVAVTTSGTTIEPSPDGWITTTGPTDLFMVLEQSLSPLLAVATDKCKSDLAVLTVCAVRAYNAKLLALLSDEEWKPRFLKFYREQQQQSEEEVPELSAEELETAWRGQRAQYACAFANDIVRCQDNLELLQDSFGPGGDIVSDYLADLVLVTDRFLAFVSHNVTYTLEPGLSQCFAPGWQENDPVNYLVLPTIQDFLGDLNAALHPSWTVRLAQVLMREVTHRYIVLFFKATATVKAWEPDVPMLIQRDAITFRQLWVGVFEGHTSAVATYNLDSMFVLSEMLEVTDATTFAPVVNHLLKSFPDCPTDLVLTVLEKKPDSDRHVTVDCLGVWCERVAYQERDADDRPTANVEVDKSTILAEVPRETFIDRKRHDKLFKELEKREREKKEKEREAREKQEKANNNNSNKDNKDKEKKEKDKDKDKKKSSKDKEFDPTRPADVEVVKLEDLLK